MNKTLMVALVAAVVGFGAGWTANGWRLDTKISTLKKDHAEAVAKSEKDYGDRLASAIGAADKLLTEKVKRENTFDQTLREKNDEINRLTTGRRCLDAGVVGVLNQSIGSAPNGWPVAKAAGLSLRTDAGTATGADERKGGEPDAEGPYATDTDVAGWINLCRTRYNACRADRDDIGRFYEVQRGASDE